MKAIILVSILGEERYVSGYWADWEDSVNGLDRPTRLISSRLREKALELDLEKYENLINNIVAFLEKNKVFYLTKII